VQPGWHQEPVRRTSRFYSPGHASGASKLGHSNGGTLECGSLLPPWFGEACFASCDYGWHTPKSPSGPYLDVDKAAGRIWPCGVWTICGSKLPQVKAQASLRTRAPASALIREVKVLSRQYALQPVTDCNCAAVRQRGEQQEVNDPSVG